MTIVKMVAGGRHGIRESAEVCLYHERIRRQWCMCVRAVLRCLAARPRACSAVRARRVHVATRTLHAIAQPASRHGMPPLGPLVHSHACTACPCVQAPIHLCQATEVSTDTGHASQAVGPNP